MLSWESNLLLHSLGSLERYFRGWSQRSWSQWSWSLQSPSKEVERREVFHAWMAVEKLQVDQRKLVLAYPQTQSQTWNLSERWNTLESRREPDKVLCTAEKVKVLINPLWWKHVNRRINWAESDLVSGLEQWSDEGEL